MKIKFDSGIKNLFVCKGRQRNGARPAEEVDLREEYAKAFRTESYTDFWTHVLALNRGNLTPHRSLGSTTAARLSSYRLFAENLLDPDQSAVKRILSTTSIHPKILPLLTHYFSTTSDASYLCGLILKDIDYMRRKFKSFDAIASNQSGSCPKIKHLPIVVTRVTLFSRSNPFSLLGQSMTRFRAVQVGCSDLLKQLESRRDKTQSKIRRLKKLKFGSAVVLVALTATLVVVAAAHAFVMLVAAPGYMVGSLEMVSIEQLARWSAQVDAAAKGTYILMRDLDTISRLLARLNNELERVDGLMQLWVQRGGDDRHQGSEEVASQLNRNNQSFMEQLDELEEHLYLCFMTINRARNLVAKQILISSDTSAATTCNSSNK